MGGQIKIVFLRIIEYLFNYRKPRIYFPPQKKKFKKKLYNSIIFPPKKKFVLFKKDYY